MCLLVDFDFVMEKGVNYLCGLFVWVDVIGFGCVYCVLLNLVVSYGEDCYCVLLCFVVLYVVGCMFWL